MLKYKAEDVPPAVGLTNPAQVCWLNSILQFLLSLPALTHMLLTCESSLKQNVFARTFIEVIKSLMAGIGFDTNTLLRALLQRATKKGIKVVFDQAQHCANEALVKIIELLGSEHVDNIFLTRYNVRYSKCSGPGSQPGTVCGWAYQQSQITNCLVVMHDNHKMQTAQQFRNWLLKHECVHSWICPECNTTNSSVIVETLGKLSEVLIIVFDQFGQKHCYYYPDELTFSGTDGPMRYKLVARIDHSGSTSGGHYWVNALRTENGQSVWKTINDSSVSTPALTADNIPEFSSSVFMLAYHLV